MSDKPENPPAFGHGDPTHGGHPGMELRDYFAAQALAAIIAKVPPTPEAPVVTPLVRSIAVGAYNYADAMLLARNASNDGERGR